MMINLGVVFTVLLLFESYRIFFFFIKTILSNDESKQLFSLPFFAVTIQYTNFPQQPQKASKGQDITLPCVVKALPVPKLAWKKDGELVTNDSRHVVTGTALRIQQVRRSDMGKYYCVAWNRGSVQAKFTLLLITGNNLYIFMPFQRGPYFSCERLIVPVNYANSD